MTRKTVPHLFARLVLGIAATLGALATVPIAHAADAARYQISAAPFSHNGDLGYWAAADQGFFKEAGIDIKSLDLETRVLARDAVSSGTVNLSHVSINTSLPAFEAGEPIKVVASIFPRWPIVTIFNPKILAQNNLTEDAFRKLDAKARYELLRGKKIALITPGGLEDQTFRAQLLALGQKDADTFAQIQYLQSYGALEANFLHGTIDAIVSDAANGKWFSGKGQGVQLLTGEEQDQYLPATVIPAGAWIVNTKWLAKDNNADALKAFLAAWLKGNKWVASLSKDDFRKWILKAYPEVTDKNAADKIVLIAETNLSSTSLDGRLSPALFDRIVQFALGQGTIKKPLAAASLYTWDYLP